MGTGYFLVKGDKTTCGGSILTGADGHSIHGQATARNGDKYICGKDKQIYHIAGGQPNYYIHGVQAAGTAHSTGTCSCKCHFISSVCDCIYGYESNSLSAPKSIANTNKLIATAPQNATDLSNLAPGPSNRIDSVKSPREIVDAGFCVLPYGATPTSYDHWFFITPPAGTRELFHQLNPHKNKKPGSILIIADPEKKDVKQIEILEAARDKIDKALEPLSNDEARLLHDNRTAIDIFSSQLHSDALSTSGDVMGYIKEVGGKYYTEINKILEEIEELYQKTYSQNNGRISGEEFFGKRKMLFAQLDSVLNRFSKSQLGLPQYESLKKALGLSTHSITHKWDQAGIGAIEGYASYVEKSAKIMQLMKKVGYIGVGLDFAGYSENVYEACSKGREDACYKTAIIEYSKFGGKQLAGNIVGPLAGIAGRRACMWVLGILTEEVGGIGAALCLVTGISTGIAGSKVVEIPGEDAGKTYGEVIYEKLFDK